MLGEPNATAVAPVADPPEAGAPTPSTLENLEANTAAELSLTTGASATPEGSQAPGDPNAAPDGQAEGTTPAEVDGKTQRIMQENAAMRLALRKFKLEPNSDTLEQFNSGLLTPEDILGIPAAPVAPLAPATPTATPMTTDQKVANLHKIWETIPKEGAVTSDDFRDIVAPLMEMVSDGLRENAELKQAREQDNRTSLASQTAQAATQVFETAVTAELPDDVKAIAQELFLGAVDNRVYELAADPSVGHDKAVSVEGYTFAAKQLAPKFDALVNAIKGNPPTPTPTPAGAPAGANPVRPLAPGSGGGGTPPPAPKDKFEIENLRENVNNYLATVTPRA